MKLSTWITDVFEYNQHFVAMMNVINAARLNPPESGHKHHIVPRCWFKMKGIPIDNSDDNLVLLTYEDHCKVHKLALLCGKDKVIRSKLGWALKRLTFGHFLGCHHTEESKEKNRLAHLGKATRTGSKLTLEQRKHLSEVHKGLPGNNKGKTFTAEHKQKLSATHKGKTFSEFGKKFKEHYDITSCDNRKLYHREYMYYANNGKCSWE